MVNLELVFPEIFLSLSIMFLLILGVFKKNSSKLIQNISLVILLITSVITLNETLGIQDVVYWARELGGSKTSIFQYPHPDWRVWYFLSLLVFYLLLTKISELILDRISKKIYLPI